MAKVARSLSIGNGVVVPYPEPSSMAATKIAKANYRRDSRPELTLRRLLHRHGLRYRKDHLIRCSNGLKARGDVVFTRALVAVFVDGCFWHGCPDHGRIPNSNANYWGPKLSANRARDGRVDEGLVSDGWRVVRVWEHEEPNVAADRIVSIVREQRGTR